MGDFDSGKFALRIERGSASDEELAALTVVLCSVLPGLGEESGDQTSPNTPLWRPERADEGYRSPYSWQ